MRLLYQVRVFVATLVVVRGTRPEESSETLDVSVRNCACARVCVYVLLIHEQLEWSALDDAGGSAA
jgi:hypothetical protein